MEKKNCFCNSSKSPAAGPSPHNLFEVAWFNSVHREKPKQTVSQVGRWGTEDFMLSLLLKWNPTIFSRVTTSWQAGGVTQQSQSAFREFGGRWPQLSASKNLFNFSDGSWNVRGDRFESSMTIMIVNLTQNMEYAWQALLLQAYVSPFSIKMRRTRKAASAFLQSWDLTG